MNQQERINAMSDVMVAAKLLGDIEDLVAGRPGSWEADIVRRMAASGGTAKQKHVKALAPLFVAMGQAKEDGGDVLSQAMGKAVNELGGLDVFAGTSQWYWDLVNIGCQYSDYEYPTGGY